MTKSSLWIKRHRYMFATCVGILVTIPFWMIYKPYISAGIISGTKAGTYQQISKVLVGIEDINNKDGVKVLSRYRNENTNKEKEEVREFLTSTQFQHSLKEHNIWIKRLVLSNGASDNACFISSAREIDPDHQYIGFVQDGLEISNNTSSNIFDSWHTANLIRVSESNQYNVDDQKDKAYLDYQGHRLKPRSTNLRSLAVMYSSSMQIFANKIYCSEELKYRNISSGNVDIMHEHMLLHRIFTDGWSKQQLSSKESSPWRIYIGQPGSGNAVLTKQILRLYGVSEEQLQNPTPLDTLSDKNLNTKYVFYTGDLEDAKKYFEKNKLDLGFFLYGFGAPVIRDLIALENVRLVSLDRAKGYCQAYPNFRTTTIQEGVYASSKALTGSVLTIEVPELLVCNSDLDDYTAYHVVKALADAKTELLQANLSVSNLSVAEPKGNLYYTPHPGALRFFKNEGEPWSWNFAAIKSLLVHNTGFAILSLAGASLFIYMMLKLDDQLQIKRIRRTFRPYNDMMSMEEVEGTYVRLQVEYDEYRTDAVRIKEYKELLKGYEEGRKSRPNWDAFSNKEAGKESPSPHTATRT